jgi:hypothetical protein
MNTNVQIGITIQKTLRDDFREVAKSKGLTLASYIKYLMSEEVRKYEERK